MHMLVGGWGVKQGNNIWLHLMVISFMKKRLLKLLHSCIYIVTCTVAKNDTIQQHTTSRRSGSLFTRLQHFFAHQVTSNTIHGCLFLHVSQETSFIVKIMSRCTVESSAKGRGKGSCTLLSLNEKMKLLNSMASIGYHYIIIIYCSLRKERKSHYLCKCDVHILSLKDRIPSMQYQNGMDGKWDGSPQPMSRKIILLMICDKVQLVYGRIY